MVTLDISSKQRRITLNGQGFALGVDENDRPLPIRMRPVPVRSERRAAAGKTVRSDNIKLDRLRYPWNLGLGFHRMDRETGRGVGGFRNAEGLDARFENMLALAILNETETHAAPLDHMKARVHFKGDLWGFYESDYSTTKQALAGAAKFGATSDDWTPPTDAPTRNGDLTTGSGDADTSGTVNHTAQAVEANRSVVARIATHDGGTQSPTGVTWNGNAMTKVAESTGGSLGTSTWSIEGSSTGAQDCIVSWSQAVDSWEMTVEDWYFVNQSTPFGTSVDDSGTGTTASMVLATGAGDWGLVNKVHATNEATAPGSGETEVADFTSDGFWAGEEEATGTSLTLSCTWSTSSAYVATSIAFLAEGHITKGSDSNTEGVRIFGATVHKGNIWVIGTKGRASGDETQYETWKSPDGAGWTPVAGSGWPTTDYVTTVTTRRNNFDDKHADIIGSGNNLIAAIYEDPASTGGSVSQVRILNSTDSGANWTAIDTVPVSDTPNIRLDHFKDPFVAGNVTVPVLFTSDNVYKIDIGNTLASPMLSNGSLSGSAGDALGAALASDGNLYLGTQNGDIIQVVTSPEVGIRQINVGPATRAAGVMSDGLVANLQGHANFILGTHPTWLFVAYGGHAASTDASILAMEYTTQRWYPVHVDDTANQDMYMLTLSVEDDGVERLHFVTEGASAATLEMQENVNFSPVTGIAQKFVATGFIEFAEEDFGDPHNLSAVLQALADAIDLSSSTSGEYIQLQWGADGAAYTANDGGDFLSTDKDLVLGANGIGESAKTFRVRLDFFRDGGDTSQTPKLRDFELQARNKVDTIWRFEIPIDIAATARNEDIQPEVVINRINTIKDSAVLLRFIFGEDGSEVAQTFNVEMSPDTVLSLEFVAPESIDQGADIDPTERAGTGTLVLEEVY